MSDVVEIIIPGAIEVGTGSPGPSAYELAVLNGFDGTLDDYLASLHAGVGMSVFGLAFVATPSAQSARALLGFESPSLLIALLEAAWPFLPVDPPPGSGKAWRSGDSIRFTP